MNLHHLRSFVTVAEELSFSRAAKRLHISQPPLSRRIRALENELGLRLLFRDRNSVVSLTDAGNSLLTDAKRVLAAADATVLHAQEAVSGARGRLNIASNAPLCTAVLPRLLHAFREKYPNVEIFLVPIEKGEKEAALCEGRIHLGIYSDDCAPRGRRFRSQPVFSCPMLAVLPRGHDLARESRSGIGLRELEGETFLIPSPTYSRWFTKLCVTADFSPASTHPVDGVENLFGMVTAGYGVGILPEALVGASVHACKTRRLVAPVPLFRLTLVCLREAKSAVLQNFLAVAKQCAQETSPQSNPRAGK